MSEEPIRNDALLRKVGDVIAAEPERYNQRQWTSESSCGTVACVAGHAVLEDPDAELRGRVDGCRLATLGDGKLYDIERAASNLLGLQDREALKLFSGGWRPAGWTPEMGDAEVAALVRDALYRLADDAAIHEVTEYRE